MIKIILILTLVFLSPACQKERQVSPATDSLKAVSASEPNLNGSAVAGSKPILKHGIAVDHSLPELDALTTAQLALSVFRSNGELFVLDSVTRRTTQLTFTQGQIDTFFLSPTRKYLACLKILATVPTPGEWAPGENPYVTDIHGILVIGLAEGNTIREIHPSDWNLQFTEWLSNSRFHYTTDDGFAVSAFYIFDALRDTLQLLPYGSFE